MLIFLVGIFTLGFLIIIGRFVYIQVGGEVQSVDLIDYSNKYRQVGQELSYERGKIMDRTGMVLADNRPTYKLYAIIDESYSENSPTPLHVKNPSKTAEKLAPFLEKEPNEIEQIITNGIENDRFQVEFGMQANNLSEAEMEDIEELGLPGINFEQQMQRYYPNGAFASHILGYTRAEKGEPVAEFGVELEWDEYLQGEPGSVSYKRDKYGYKLLNADEVVKPPKNGDHVYLTIDQKIQTFLEDAMTTIEKEYQPERMVAAVMDPKTGEMLAMSNRPTFNPNHPENITNWYNDVISYPIEPGSTMKMFTVAAAMEEGVYNGSETYESGKYRINENYRYIRDHNNVGWGEITYDEGIQRSSNVAVAKLLWEKIKPDTFMEYIEAFHLDRMSGIDLSGERLGKMVYQYPMEKVTMSYGQGSTFTPMQIMKAATAIANDGKMVKPYVISSVVDSESEEILYEKEPEIVGEPISAETSKQLRDLFETVITGEHGTGKNFKLDSYSSLGKTGTSQLPDPETGGWLTGPSNYLFSFMGMAPKDDPELLMFVAVKQPNIDYSYEGSRTTSYIYKTVMENSLNYLNVQPDQENSDQMEPIVLDNIIGSSIDDLEETYEEKGIEVVSLGTGEKAADSRPIEGDRLFPSNRLLVLTEGEAKMPNLLGWPLRDVLHLSELLDLELEFDGSGFVVEQSIKPGTKLNEDDQLVIELQSKEQQFENQQSESAADDSSDQDANEDE